MSVRSIAPISLPQNPATDYDRRLQVMLYDYLRRIDKELKVINIGTTVLDADYGDITVSSLGSVWNLDLNLSQIDAPTGAVNFADQQATSFRIENRTSDPGSPTTGQIWLRTDL